MNPLRVLIVGASGFIGRYLVARLSWDPGLVLFCTFRSRPPGNDRNHWYQLELADPVALEKLFGVIQPEVVLHLAALADVGTAEREPERAAAVNAAATANIARLSEEYGARLVFVSTEYVFDGQRGPYREDETPSPVTQYGRTKRDAEREVATLTSRWSILRTSIVYGWPTSGGRNFVPGLIDRLQRGETYAGSTRVMRSPVYVEHLVESLARLARVHHPGIYHVAGRDWVSMYDFAVAAAGEFGLDPGLVVQAEAQTDSPDRLGLDCVKSMELLGMEQFGLVEGLAEMRASADSPLA